MSFISRYHKKCRIAFLRISLIAVGMSAVLLPNIRPISSVGNNMFTLYVNDTEIGKVTDPEDAATILSAARRLVAGNKDRLVLIEAEYDVVGEEVLRGTADDADEMIAKVAEVYSDSLRETMQQSYTVKIDEYMVNVSSTKEVVELLEASIRRYDPDGKFSVNLVADPSRQLPVYVPVIYETVTDAPEQEKAPVSPENILGNAGIYKEFTDIIANAEPEEELGFEDYEYGIVDVSFANSVEVVESYLPARQITSLSDAIDDVTKDKEQKTIYEVVSGDTLSGIAVKTGISIDDIIAMNENIQNINSIIRIGDEITVTVPKPELSVLRDEIVYYEGTYEADVIYVYNDDWYTTSEVTLQDPSSGYHKAVQKITYLNGEAISTETVMEEVVAEAIPKIVEKGTKIPPTYIKPISGGVLTSGFGGRTSLIAGMTTYHGAVDWGCPTGTSVMASCGGVVTQAGWMSSYGYCIFINHPDGRQTRYAHLSKVLVSKGQYVSQGQKIGLSGMTGVATGPHLHFEMRINGKAVNPLNYLN